MPRQRLLLLASWVVTTMVATVVSAAGVSIVTRDVTDSHRAALGRADVIALLAGPLPADVSTSVPVTPPPAPPSTTVAPTTTAPATTAALTIAPPETSAPPTTAAPSPPAPTTTTFPPLGDVVAATYSSSGGSITVACLGEDIALLSARPNDGYRFVVETDGPEWVYVRFDNDHDDRDGLAAWCRDGAPTDDRGGRDRGGHVDDDSDRDRDDDGWPGDGWSGDGRGGGR